MAKALFLDRDGTINVGTAYLDEIEKCVVIDGVFCCCRRAEEPGYLLIVVTNESGSSEQLLENSMGDGLMSSLKGKFALWLAKTFIQESGQTIGQVAGVFLSDVIVAIVLFVVYCIALGIICWLLRTLFAKMHTSDSKVLVGIDRTCGAIISTAFALVFIMVVLAILNSLKGKIPTVDSAIESSTVCKYFYENNPIAKLFAEIFG